MLNSVYFLYKLFRLAFVAGSNDYPLYIVRRRADVYIEEFIAVSRVYYLETFLYKERTELPKFFE